MSDQAFLTNSCNLIPNGRRCLEPLRSQAWLSAPRHEREGNSSEVKKSGMTICEKRFFGGSGGNSKKYQLFNVMCLHRERKLIEARERYIYRYENDFPTGTIS